MTENYLTQRRLQNKNTLKEFMDEMSGERKRVKADILTKNKKNVTDIFTLRQGLMFHGFPITMPDENVGLFIEDATDSDRNSAFTLFETLHSAVLQIGRSNVRVAPAEDFSRPTTRTPIIICELNTESILSVYFYEHPTLKVLIPVKQIG